MTQARSNEVKESEMRPYCEFLKTDERNEQHRKKSKHWGKVDNMDFEKVRQKLPSSR